MSSGEKHAGYLHDMTPPALMLATALLTTLLLNLALRGSSLWYWFPVKYNESVKLYAWATETESPDVVILGSSVSGFGLIPRVMEEELNRALPRPEPWRVYNASHFGGYLPNFIEISRRLLARRPKPRLVLVMLAPFNCNSALNTNLNIELFLSGARDFFTVMRYTPRNDARWAAVNSATSVSAPWSTSGCANWSRCSRAGTSR